MSTQNRSGKQTGGFGGYQERFSNRNLNRIDESTVNPLIVVKNPDLKLQLQQTITKFAYKNPIELQNTAPAQAPRNETPTLMTAKDQRKVHEDVLKQQQQYNAWKQLTREKVKRLQKINNSYKSGIVAIDSPELEDTVFFKEQ